MTDRQVSVALFVLTFVAYAWFFNGGGWNQNSQFDLTRALVERQTLHIDGYRVNTGDVSWSPVSGEWHAYTNKPPGVSFLAAVPYAPLYALERALNRPVDSWFWVTLNAWMVTALTCGVTGALMPVVLYWYGRRMGVAPRAAAFAAVTLAFGTIVFPYATMLFAHVPAAFFLLLALYWLDRRPFLAGIAAGVAGLCFYICIPAAAVLFAGAWLRSRRDALRFLLGGLPFGILLGLYHWVCFGSPFVTAVETSVGFTEKGLLFGVFRTPSWRALWGLTFGEERGLFFVSPVLLLACVGMVVMLRRRGSKREVLMILSVVALFLFAIASFNNWDGGRAFGPRYLLPMIPLLALPLLYLPDRTRWWLGVPLMLASFAIQFAGTAVDPMLHAGLRQPVQDSFASLSRGLVSINPETIDAPVATPYPARSKEATWAAFNAGELVFGASNVLSLIPIALWILLGSAWLIVRGNR